MLEGKNNYQKINFSQLKFHSTNIGYSIKRTSRMQWDPHPSLTPNPILGVCFFSHCSLALALSFIYQYQNYFWGIFKDLEPFNGNFSTESTKSLKYLATGIAETFCMLKHLALILFHPHQLHTKKWNIYFL